MSLELFDESVEKYRALEIQEGVQVLKDLMNQKVPPEFFTGAIEMLRRLINLPKKMANRESDDQVRMANELISKGFNQFERTMVRRLLEEPTSPGKD